MGTSASVALPAPSQLIGNFTNATLSANVVIPDAVSGDKILDPDFDANGQLQSTTTLSNSYDPATGTSNFTARDLEASNQLTQPYASSTGSIDPATGEYKPGTDGAGGLPAYGLYNRFPRNCSGVET
jgi:hypothetical protein